MDSILIPVIIQMLNFSLIIGWLVITILALIKLRKRDLLITPKTMWVILILCIPLFGAVAFFVINPKNDNQGPGTFDQTGTLHS